MRYAYSLLTFMLLFIFEHNLNAQVSSIDSVRIDLRKKIEHHIADGCELLGDKCNNSFFFLVYSIESDASVFVDLIATDSIARKAFLQAKFENLNAKILDYAKSLGGGKMNIVQPFYIGCEQYTTWVDIVDIQSAFTRLDKLYPGTKVLLQFQSIEFRNRRH